MKYLNFHTETILILFFAMSHFMTLEGKIVILIQFWHNICYFLPPLLKPQKGKQKKQGGGYNKPVTKKEEKKERKRTGTRQRDSKSVKQLLGELYADKEYLENVVKAIGK